MSVATVGESEDRIQVCCVFLCRDDRGRLLLHRRTDACRDEAGTWDCGGGALEFGEEPFEAVRREVREEYGTSAKHIRPLGMRNVLREEDTGLTHWVALVFDVLVDPGAVRIGEPEKMEHLAWFEVAALPHPLHSQLGDHLALLPPLRGVQRRPRWNVRAAACSLAEVLRRGRGLQERLL